MSKDTDDLVIAMENDGALIGVVSEIVSAYVGNNPVPVSDLPGLIENTYNVVSDLNSRTPKDIKVDQKPAVSVRKSLSEDFLICLEDGKKFKSLKRHLRTRYNMSPDEYREKWGLASDYPMVAPNYAKQRSDLAKRMGLGQAKK